MARSTAGTPLTIAVIGAGIGGLTAAVAFRQAGFAVDVYEQAPELTEVGGGINMGPNAARILSRLGLGDALDRDAVRPISTHQRRWQDGRTLQRAPLNPRCEQLYGAPHLTVHRADLLSIIASGFPAERIHLGYRFVSVADKGDRVVASFANGAQVEVDVLIGADGIHSMVRAALLGDEAPRFVGCVAYRGLVPAERIADLELPIGSQSWVGPGGHFVHYCVSRGRLLNFVGWTEHDTWNREDWTDRATVARALAAFDGWHPQVRRIIAAAETASCGRCSIATRCRDGRSVARPCLATRAIRCTRSWGRAPPRRSRTAPLSPPASLPARVIQRTRYGAMKPCAGHV